MNRSERFLIKRMMEDGFQMCQRITNQRYLWFNGDGGKVLKIPFQLRWMDIGRLYILEDLVMESE
jgi:hypothetical protein